MKNRQIKFRAWDIKNNKYAQYEKGKNCEYSPFKGMENEFNFVNENDFVFEQFTGLIDKNGVEIYEGDLIKISHPFKDRSFTGAVEYFEHGFGCKNFNFSHFDNPCDIFSEGTEYIEKVGNIHQKQKK